MTVTASPSPPKAAPTVSPSGAFPQRSPTNPASSTSSTDHNRLLRAERSRVGLRTHRVRFPLLRRRGRGRGGRLLVHLVIQWQWRVRERRPFSTFTCF